MANFCLKSKLDRYEADFNTFHSILLDTKVKVKIFYLKPDFVLLNGAMIFYFRSNQL